MPHISGRGAGGAGVAQEHSTDEVSCGNCAACCCRLEVLIVTDTGVPERYIEVDRWGQQTMARLDDGWCAALDRSTLLCSIYAQRPWVCREFAMGGDECLAERKQHMR